MTLDKTSARSLAKKGMLLNVQTQHYRAEALTLKKFMSDWASSHLLDEDGQHPFYSKTKIAGTSLHYH